MLQRTERGQKVKTRVESEGRQRVVCVQQGQSWDRTGGWGSLHEHCLVGTEGTELLPAPGSTRSSGTNTTAAPWICTDTAGWTHHAQQGCPFKYAEVTQKVKLQKRYNLGFIHTSLSCRSWPRDTGNSRALLCSDTAEGFTAAARLCTGWQGESRRL